VSIRPIKENTPEFQMLQSLPIHVIKVLKLNTFEINRLKYNSGLESHQSNIQKQIGNYSY